MGAMDREYKEKVVRVGSTSLWTVTQGTGPPLVLCHGGPGLWDDLRPVANSVDDLVTVHRYDQRGGGRSSKTPPYTVSKFVEDLESLREHWGYEQWIVGGHSWGASLALAYAVQHPDRVEGIVSVSGTGLGWGWHAEYKQEVRRRLGEERESELNALKNKRDKLDVGSEEFAAVDRQICRIQWSTDFANAERAPELVEALIDERFIPNYEVNKMVTEDWKQLSVTQTFRTAVSRIACPVLIVHGVDDPRPVSAVEQFAKSLPDARLELIDGVGHFPWIERPSPFRDQLQAFVVALSDNRSLS